MERFTVRHAARRLGVGYSPLKQWIYDGRVRTTTTAGGHHRVADTEIERLLAPQRRPSKARPTPRERGVIVSLSGRNQLHGYITRDAVAELKLRRGDPALAIVKATEVMIARQAD